MNDIDLLSRVLAVGGRYAILGLNGKSPIQKLVDTREEFDELAREYVAQGRDVYFGCSKFGDENNRTKGNVKSIKHFGLI